MGQEEYDNFKQWLKDWMDTHPDEYDLFEEEMNRKDAAGYQKIMNLAVVLVPSYQKIIRQKVNQGTFDDISDIENLFTENKLAQSLLNKLENPNNDSTVPAVLAWLYFGQSFERMVEKGEELRKSLDISYLQKFMIAATNKILVFRSIKLDFRTKADWEKHRRLMQLVDGDSVMDWAIENFPGEKKKTGRKKTGMSLAEMFSHRVEDKELLQNRIEEYVKTKHTNQDLARLKIALDELEYIKPVEIKPLRDALAGQYADKVQIVGERGIQSAYRELNAYIQGKGMFVKDYGKDREAINGIKEFLSG
ncbi:hypothetical protein EZS27_012960 [termite gut metagenome]|uniref:Uncharacterized protein n=1 Tax=termite gut metagenome TaxID=433724 RepID=A0A5J4RZ66_9ZZZZ